MSMTKERWIVFSGLIWLAAGSSLLYKGISFLLLGVFQPQSFSSLFESFFGSIYYSAVFLTGVGILIGFLKSRFVLSKTVKRISMRIRSLPQPVGLRSIYPPSYWILIASMMGLGMCVKLLPIPLDARGFVDITIGFALVSGSFCYFQAARSSS